MKLGTKIFGGFGIILVLLVLVAVVGFTSLFSVADRVEKADNVNRLVKHILQARQQEKNFIIRKDERYTQQVDDFVAKIEQLAQKTKNSFSRKTNQEQMDEVANAVGQYSTAFHTYVDLRQQKQAALKEMRINGQKVLEITEKIRSDQKLELDDIISRDTAMIKDKRAKVDDANQLFQYALEAKTYRISMIQGNKTVLGDWQNKTDQGGRYQPHDQVVSGRPEK